MNNAKLGAAVVAGYVLGRCHKARWALTLAGMAAGKKLSAKSGVLRDQLDTPQLRHLADDVREEFTEVGKKAAVAAASNQVSALTKQLRRRTESLREATAREATARHGEESDDTEEEPEDLEEEEQPAARRRTSHDGTATESRESSTRAAPTRDRSESSAASRAGEGTPRTGGTRLTSRPVARTSAQKTAEGAAHRSTGSRASTRKRG